MLTRGEEGGGKRRLLAVARDETRQCDMIDYGSEWRRPFPQHNWKYFITPAAPPGAQHSIRP